MDEKNLDAQQIADEELEGAAGGTRANARLDARTRGAAEADETDTTDDEILVRSSPWAVICPNCGHTLRYCTCARK